MKKRSQKFYIIAVSFLAAFILWTAAICRIDVQPIGPGGSTVGFAALNRFVHDFTGVSMLLYTITDWLGLVPLLFALGFAVLGLVQWVKRKRFLKVDRSILVLGGFYLAVIAAYVFFEMYAINYRPVLLGEYLEASYPSSTTMLTMCVMPTAAMQFHNRIRNKLFRQIVCLVMSAFVVFTVIGRLISGVHWFTDIVGGALLSAGLVMLYYVTSGL